jgi:quercetin dioxygenase-like cupin family protein
MKLSAFAAPAISFALGTTSLYEVETHTTWLSRFQRHEDYAVADTNAMPWVHGGEPGRVSFDMKFLHNDHATHEVAMLLRYPAGQVNPSHQHSFGHGMYVLQGHLKTHRGVYGPGSFVWFPADETMSHGATADEDVVVMFLRHDDMTTTYVEPKKE